MVQLNVDEDAVAGIDTNVAEWTVADSSFPTSVWIEGIVRGETSLELVLSQLGTEVVSDVVALDIQAKVTSVKVVVPETNVKNYGVVNPDGVKNPNGETDDADQLITPDFKGGHRFFPGSRTYKVEDSNNPNGNNIVRVRANLAGMTDADVGETMVYFRSFDVDDPSDDPFIDNDDETGEANDNRGRLQDIDFDAIAADGGVAAPSETHQTGGFRGYLRPILKDFDDDPVNQGKWQPLAQNGEVTEAWAPVLKDADGSFYAAVDLATSYAPGDNFRVAAAVSESSVKAIQEMDANDAPVNKPAPRATEQISVWRYFHIEQDRMATTEAVDKFESLYRVEGSTHANHREVVIPGSVFANYAWNGGLFRDSRGINYPITNEIEHTIEGTADRLEQVEGDPDKIVIRFPGGSSVDANEFKDGVLSATVPGVNEGDPPEKLLIGIKSHTAIDINNEIFVTPNDVELPEHVERIASTADEVLLAGELVLLVNIDPAKVVDPDLPIGDSGFGTLYEDDFTNIDLDHPLGISNDEPTTRIDPSDVVNTNDRFYHFLQNSVNRAENRFADAYMVPRLDTLDEFDSSEADPESFVESVPHLTEGEGDVSLILQASYAGSGLLAGDDHYEVNPAFWATWVTSAYEFDPDRDGDGAEAGVLGVAKSAEGFEMPFGVFMFVESLRDASQGDMVFTDLATGRDNFFSAVTTHEIAHLFNISRESVSDPHLDKAIYGENIMIAHLDEITSENNFYFHGIDIASLRRNWQSPGTVTEEA